MARTLELSIAESFPQLKDASNQEK
jgi:hypothetical protein